MSAVDGTLRVVIAGGGTGGHLFPALAIAEALRRLNPAVEIVFCGSDRGIERERVPASGFPLVTFPVRGLGRKGAFWKNGVVILGFLRALAAAIGWLRSFRPRIVLGTGGYSSAPAVVGAILCRVPVVLQEQNCRPGLVTRLLSRWACEVYVSFEESPRFLARPKRAVVVGNPVRPGIQRIPKEAARASFGFDPQRPVVLVFGGSQGARRINEVLLAGLPGLLERTEAVFLWGTGPTHFQNVKERLAQIPQAAGRVLAMPFIEDMARAYSACELAVCRAGATTLAELTALGVPSLLVPYPYAAEDHQALNARALAARGAAVVIPEKDLTGERLAGTIEELLSRPDRLQAMARAAAALARPQAAETIADRILSLVAGSQN
ncbi:MAG: undecaprenyldiphospho-muramoylpentapeptide beta-N-acetylglucosaminyltransferase [candidate division KSB1 bacterium]|nr:undecaprenyldiphospho-muramoylpentapeptide beta-N-acetylglucosaminyltransferase [candidate division KSB1 bacterium]